MSITINGTTGVSGVDGTAAAPSVQGADSNTGVFFPAADTVAVSTGGSERLRIDTSGNVGIGVTANAAIKLDVNGPVASRAALTADQTSAGVMGYTGTTTQLISYGSAVTGGIMDFYTGLGAVTPTLRMRIGADGDVQIGTTTAGGKLTLSWNSSTQQGFVLRTTAATFAGSPVVFQTSAGATAGFISQTATPSVAYNTTSDYRLKENVQPMVGALDKIAQLNPVTYTWKSDGSDGQGFIAHELQAVVPDCVSGEKDAVDEEGNPKHQGVDTSFLVATLVSAVQELTARIAALEAK
jgi:hypothetical protein